MGGTGDDVELFVAASDNERLGESNISVTLLCYSAVNSKKISNFVPTMKLDLISTRLANCFCSGTNWGQAR